MFSRFRKFRLCPQTIRDAMTIAEREAKGMKIPRPSHIGRQPVAFPDNTSIQIVGNKFTVTGPLGSITRTVPDDVIMERTKGDDIKAVSILRKYQTKASQSLQGTIRQHLNNMVEGVTGGWSRHLVLKGVGYRAHIQDGFLFLHLGNKYKFPLPQHVTVTVIGGTNILVEGIDIESVTLAAAKIRDFQRPDPYKGKGVRYYDEVPKLRSPKGKK